MMKNVMIVCALLVAVVRAGEPITIESLLTEMINRDAVARFPAQDFRLKQHSSYNRASKTPDDATGWFMNHDYNSGDRDKNFVRIEEVNGHKEWVLMDHQGAGALVRTWMPWLSQQSAETGTMLRLYLDGAKEPTIEGNMLGLFDGTGLIPYPLAHPSLRSAVSFFSIPYAKRCKVTVTERPFFFQFTFREYAQGTPVKTFTMADFEAARGLTKKVGETLLNPPSPGEGVSLSYTTTLGANQEKALALPTGVSAVRKLTVKLGSYNTNPGTQSQPLASLAVSQEKARDFAGKESVLVHVADGVYYLPETLVFTSADSGSERYPVVYRAENEGGAVLSGGSKLDLQWTPYRDGIFQAATPAGFVIDQLFINGQGQRMARYPNYDPDVAIFGGYAEDAVSPERVATWADPAGGYLHALHRNRWGSYHYRFTGKNPDGSIQSEGGWQTNRKDPMHARYRFVENIQEELDVPGEWYHDRKAGLLFFYPPAGMDLNRATVEVVRLRRLVELRGTREEPVRFISLSGFAFRHANRTFMESYEPILRSDWSIHRNGAIYIKGAEDCMLDHCSLEDLGGNAVFVSNYNRRILIRTCRIQDCGASGVVFLGNPAAVRNALTKTQGDGGYAELDRTPGPLTDDYPADCTVEDCLISQLGRVEKQVAGVEISMARRITVRDCSIYEVPRAGIDIGTGRWGGHLIEGCDVFDTVLETGDHGSFNSWGRDRLMGRGVPENELAEIALLDNVEPTVIRNSRWRCDHGWDIDLDDGSSNYHIYNNLMLSGGLKFRQGFRRYAWNNVIVNNALHPHVWYPDSGDSFTRNIVMAPYRPARMGTGQWGRELDYNLFTSNEADRSVYTDHGVDVHSVVGDAQFVDPAAGNFQVAQGSPALELGFQNFPMDHFGVRDPRLRAQARTPEIPALRNISSDPSSIVYDWLGGKIRNIEGGEYSAWGISSEAGGVMVLFAPGYMAIGEIGLRDGDLINACNEKTVKSVDDLIRIISAAPADQALTMKVRREGRGDVKIVIPERPLVPQRL